MYAASLLSRVRVIVPVLTLLSLFAGTQPGRAQEAVFYATGGVALGGIDVVSYFAKGAPEPGDSAHAVMWKGAVWQFASRANREAFEADPWAYAPQYGGYCAYGVSKGLVLDTDPAIWLMRGGKLYLIHSDEIWPLWSRDIPGHIGLADAQWPDVLTQTQAR